MGALSRTSHTVVVLGGYGRVGRRVCEWLARDGVAVVVAGRSLARAEQCASGLLARHAGASIRAARADAADPASLRAAIAGAGVLAVSAPVAGAIARIAALCVEAGCDCVDITASPRVSPDFERLAAEARRRGRLVVTQAGVCPGLPSALARLASRRLDACRAVRVGIAIGLEGRTRPEHAYEIVDAAVDYAPRLFRSGAWTAASRSRSRVRFDFGPRFGTMTALPLDLPELHGLERSLGLQELGAFGATPSWPADVVFRASLAALYRVRRGLGRRTAARLLLRLAGRPSAPRGASVVAVADGRRGGVPSRCVLSVGHDEVAEGTAVVLAAFLRQHLAGAHQGCAGVEPMGHVLRDESILEDLRRMGARVDWRLLEPPPAPAVVAREPERRFTWDMRG